MCLKNSYEAKDIEVLEGLEPVRNRPGMYIGGTDDKAIHHLALEILDNSMDEAIAGHADLIKKETLSSPPCDAYIIFSITDENDDEYHEGDGGVC